MISKIINSYTYKKYHRKIKYFLASRYYNNSKYLPEGIDRVYHIHIRKSAGTSVNSAFWNLGDLTLKKIGREPLVLSKKYSFVCFNKELIEAGHYLYASAHFAQWELNLRPNTFTFTVLREPYSRLVSLYKYYTWVEQVDEQTGYNLDTSYYVLKAQSHLLGKSFKDFVDVLSDKYLTNQLYTFSKTLDVNDALSNISKVDRVYFQDNFSYAISDLEASLGLPLQVKNERNFGKIAIHISEEEKHHALSKLKDEIEFYQLALEKYKK
ncbi:sulfotransferase family 2 domain-containing protein [Winogradskyella sediminis]|uniref:sulfotransferase family 2 domain-containing protein n=1 Tax=Winogradskyella sediminis TaxID=1382466 RepID=UPI003AA91EFA